MEIRQTSTRTVYENRWMRVREDQIERQDGSPGTY
jgi:ADP-ribose pyrophosphatase